MKYLITIFLFAILFLQTFSRFVIRTDYYINKDSIAKTLCINKDKPKMHCQGKCYLAKQLKEQEKQEQQTAGTKKAKLEIQLFTSFRPVITIPVQQRNAIEHTCWQDVQPVSYHTSVFRPPVV